MSDTGPQSVQEHDVLFTAHESHYKRTGHSRFTLGMNFIRCNKCNRYAEISDDGENLELPSEYRTITPEEF